MAKCTEKITLSLIKKIVIIAICIGFVLFGVISAAVSWSSYRDYYAEMLERKRVYDDLPKGRIGVTLHFGARGAVADHPRARVVVKIDVFQHLVEHGDPRARKLLLHRKIHALVLIDGKLDDMRVLVA